ncbi:MerC domain-containing protein [Lysobacter sp. ISL-42]|nr:MerC domain-containing protein [Lysobacter sp. ISL-42]MBT2751552.1 MerC domain-containing protein [Lysobacter sp. ISL-50]MBT2775746.1 MerC domain-containing protein [Lysobacter sp. ISL-54]MBT2782289.1 MerC domain-containing protein [Lysobacter sp. ISL-52]
MYSARFFDGTAVSLSGLCLTHCIAMSLLSAVLPGIASWTQAAWLHWAFVAFAIPTTATALLRTRRNGTLSSGVAIAAILGLAALALGASELLGEASEVPITIAGSFLLAGAHVVNWRAHRH